ncbi:MAG: hypothetical protein LBV16_08385 [Elusimicrobiota bacterium]|jgi:hypothetical protein|nr:hypothetical protein [Elusimicrobiota bacterium]
MKLKKFAPSLLSFVFAVILFAGCGAGKVGIASPAAKAAPKVERVILDYKGAALGTEVPAWVEAAINDDYQTLESMPRFKDRLAVIAIESGKNLDLLKSWANNFAIQSQLSRQISNKVSAEFGGGQQGDKNSEESVSFIREVVATLSEAKISGLSKEMDYWLKIRTIDNSKKTETEQYTYYVVYSINKADLQRQIDIALGKIAAKNQEQQEIKTEVIDAVKRLRPSDTVPAETQN